MNLLQEWASTITASVATALGTFLMVRRKYSSDSKGIQQDRVESQLLDRMMRERDAALASAEKAWSQRTADAIVIARFEGLREAADRETRRLRDELFAMRLHIQKLTAIIVRLDPQYAALLELTAAPRDGIEHDTEIQFVRAPS